MIKVKMIDQQEYKKRKAKPVTNTNLIEAGVPAENGLLDSAVFGISNEDRNFLIGFVDLGTQFFHPLVYERIIKRSFRGIDNLANGSVKYSIDNNGNLIEDENGNTGLKWLMANLKETKFSLSSEDGSITTKELRKFLKDRDVSEVTLSKYPIVPISLRDMEMNETSRALDEINTLYRQLIGYVDTLKDNRNTRVYNQYTLEFRIQRTLVAIFNYFEGQLFKKYGDQRKGLMSRHTDYASRLVWSAPDHNLDSLGNDWVDIDTLGVPLSSNLKTCQLLILHYYKSVIEMLYEHGGFDIKGKSLTLPEIFDVFTEDYITDLIDEYDASRMSRTKYILNPYDMKTPIKIKFNKLIKGEDDSPVKGDEITKDMTTLEFLYIVAYIAIQQRDNQMSMSRYPIQGAFSIASMNIHITTIDKTMSINFNGIEMRFFPDSEYLEGYYDSIHDKSLSNRERMEIASKVNNAFKETLQVPNSAIDKMGGDFDKLGSVVE